MARGITLTRLQETLTPFDNRGDAFRLQIIASANTMMPKEVFGFRDNLLDPITGTTASEFSFVTSPEDLVTLPIGVADVTASPPFYRKDTIDVLVASRLIAEQMWDEVHIRVCELVDALDRKDKLSTIETVRCGEPEATSESVSQSVSQSVSESLSVSS